MSFRLNESLKRQAATFAAIHDAQAPQEEEELAAAKREVSFAIRKHLTGRAGWKIMPEAGGTLKPEALMKVVGMIKEMELKGHSVPERITIRV